MGRFGRTLLPLFVVTLFAFASPALAANVTVNGTTNFSSLDGSVDDQDHVVNGVFTVNGDLIVNGTINCNDATSGAGSSACAMQFNVSGNVVLASGSGVFAENRASDGNGANITFTVGGNVLIQGTGVSTAGAIVSSSKLNGGNNFHAGDITINAGGTVTQEGGSILAATANDSFAGAISITSGATASIGGQILSGPSRTIDSTPYTGVVMSGGGGHYVGGAITIRSTSHSEPGLIVTSSAIVASQGSETLPVTGSPVTLEGCGVQIDGLVVSMAGRGSGPGVVVRSGTTLTIDSSTLAATGGAHRACIRSDAWHEDAGAMYVHLYAAKAITIIGPPATSTLFSVNSNPGTTDKRNAGTITVISTGGGVTASGNAFQVSGTRNGDRGGDVNVSAKNDVVLDGASIDASGATSDSNRAGGSINARSYSGGISWIAGVGDVRPVGTSAGVPLAQQGSISLTSCTTVVTSGTSFPTNGPVAGVFPTITTGACSPAAPSLPVGEPALPVCCNVITVINPTVSSGPAGAPFSQTFTQTGAIGTATFSLASGTLPSGLTLATNGVLSGTPTVTGSFPITVMVTDSQGCTGVGPTYPLQITCQTITVTNPAVSSGVAGSPFSQTFTQSGGLGTTTFSIAGGTLPAGLTLASNGVLSGTPTQTGSFPITVKATDSNGCSGIGPTYSLTIACQTITVTNPAVSSGVAGTPFSQTFTQSGGIGTTTFSLASGTLPAGLTLAANGVLSGTPTQTGSFPTTVKATDSNGCNGTGATYTLVIACQTITVTNPAVNSGVAGTAFSQTFTQSGGIGTTTFSLASGTLPAGLTLAANGTLSGTPTQTGSFTITVTATDSNGCTGTGASYALTIACQTITVNNPAVTTGVAGSPFSQSFTQSGGIGTTTFSLASGTLPSGLTLASNGVLSGTPTVVGSFPITVTVTDSNGCTGTGATYNLTITCQTITVTPPAVNTGVAGSPFSQTFMQSGAIGTATFSLTAGSLPSGLTLAANGVLSGTPLQTGTFAITVTVADSNGCTGSANYTLTITCQTITVTNPAVSSGVAGASFSQTFTQSGAIGSATFSLASGSLPAGLSLSTSGVLSGTPTQTGSFPITVAVTDSNGCSGVGPTYNLTIACQTITVTNPSVNVGIAGQAFSQTFTQSGAIGTATFTLASGTLPSGLSLSASGVLSGVPLQTGTFPITVTVTDSNGCSGTSPVYNLIINCQTITVTAPANLTGTVGVAYSEQFTQSGGIGAVTFSLTGTLPTGMSFAADGTLSGTPTQSGAFPITVTATDSNGCTGSVSVTLTIGCQTITVTNPAVSSGTAGTPFSQTFTQSGANGTATFSLASGTLPSGLTLSASGVLSGTPMQTGSFPITVKVTDANGCTGTGPTYTLVIVCQTITVSNPGVTSATVGTPFSQTFTQSGAIGTATFTTSSTLPTGLTLSAAGVLSGTPTQTGTFPIVVTVTDSNGCTGTGATYTLVISCQNITVTNPSTNSGTVDAPFSQTFMQSGAIGTATFSTSSTLPSGLTLSASGVLSGNPQVPGTFPIVVTVTDSNGCTGTGATYTLTIACQTITVINPSSNSGSYNTPLSGSFTFTQSGVGTHTPAVFTINSGSLPSGVSLSSSGVLSGTPTQTGVFSISVKVTDANGCTGIGSSYTLTIGPKLTTKTYTDVGNTQLDGGLAAPATPTVISVAVSNGDSSDAAIIYAVTVPPVNGTLTTFNTDGTFLYTPNVGNTAADSFTYTGTSNGITVTRTATISFTGRVWYVDNATLSGTNDGRSNTPFTTMTAVGLASTASGDFIYVSKGAGSTTGGYNMLPSQQLIGAGATLNVGAGTLLVAGSAANTPTLSGSLVLANNVVVNGIDMSTGGSNAILGFNVTGISVTARNVTTTTGTAVFITGSTNSGSMTFTSVSANGGSNGIVLQNFAGTSSFTVTGTGAAGTGGTIRNIVGADASIFGNGVYLDTVTNVSLSWMQINDDQNFGIFGSNVTNLTLDHVVVSGVNGTNAVSPGEGSVAFTGLQGSVTVSNCNISGGLTDNFRVLNNGSQSLNRITVTATTFGPNSTASGNAGLLLQGTNGTLNATVQNCTFTSARSDLFRFFLHGTVSSDLVFTGNALSNNHPNILSGGGGVTIGDGGVGDNPTLTYLVDSNTMRDAVGSALLIGKGSGTGNFTGTISNNTIGVSGLANSGSSQSSGISVIHVGGGTDTVHITGNQIRQYNNNGIQLQIGDASQGGNGSLNATLTGNTVAQPGAFATNGVFLNVGTTSGDAHQSCFRFGGAGALANSITGSGSVPNGATDFRLRERFATTVRLPGYAGANNDNAAVTTFVQGNNGGTPTGTVANNVPTGAGYVGGAPCP